MSSRPWVGAAARSETIEDTAELVTRAGGESIAVQVDHLVIEEGTL